MPGITILFLVGISWVVIPAVLIGWLTGYADGQLIAAIIWGLIVIFIYSRSRVKLDGKIDRATLILALIQAVMGGLIVFYVGQATH
jgi:branched-subunit amino acid permease